MPDTIPVDVSETEGPMTFDDAITALENLDGAEELPEEDEEGAADDQDETPGDDAGDEGDNEDDDADGEADPDGDDEDKDPDDGDGEDDTGDEDGATGAEVEVVVDGETHKVSVDSLKRLYGQEAALTRKSQEVADLRKSAQLHEQKYSTALGALVDKAKTAWEPYSKIDWVLAPTNMTTEEFQQLRADAKIAYDDVQFLTSEADGYMSERQNAAMAEHKTQFEEAAKAAHEVLADPEKGIPGWSPEVYNGIRSFAQSEGMSPEMINTIIDPVALKVLWKASQFDKSKKIATTKTVKAGGKKVIRTKGKSVRPTASKAMDRLVKTGSIDAAVDALMELEG